MVYELVDGSVALDASQISNGAILSDGSMRALPGLPTPRWRSDRGVSGIWCCRDE